MRPRNKLLIVISGPSVPEPWVTETLVHGERAILVCDNRVSFLLIFITFSKFLRIKIHAILGFLAIVLVDQPSV